LNLIILFYASLEAIVPSAAWQGTHAISFYIVFTLNMALKEAWVPMYIVQEINKIDAYKPTKTDPKELVEFYKARFTVPLAI